MIKWLIDNWTCIFIFIGIGFIYFFIFERCNVSYEDNEQVENDIAMMRKTSASERDGATDPHDRRGSADYS